MGEDFIASELLKELKEGNARKDEQIQSLHRMVVAIILSAMLLVLATIGGFLWYLNQYDFVSTDSITYDASGVYAIVDSDGNVISQDFTSDEITTMLEALNNGQSNGD